MPGFASGGRARSKTPTRCLVRMSRYFLSLTLTSSGERESLWSECTHSPSFLSLSTPATLCVAHLIKYLLCTYHLVYVLLAIQPGSWEVVPSFSCLASLSEFRSNTRHCLIHQRSLCWIQSFGQTSRTRGHFVAVDHKNVYAFINFSPLKPKTPLPLSRLG